MIIMSEDNLMKDEVILRVFIRGDELDLMRKGYPLRETLHKNIDKELELVLPCPFCGCQVGSINENAVKTLFSMSCSNCGGGMTSSERQHLVEMWNRRSV